MSKSTNDADRPFMVLVYYCAGVLTTAHCESSRCTEQGVYRRVFGFFGPGILPKLLVPNEGAVAHGGGCRSRRGWYWHVRDGNSAIKGMSPGDGRKILEGEDLDHAVRLMK